MVAAKHVAVHQRMHEFVRRGHNAGRLPVERRVGADRIAVFYRKIVGALAADDRLRAVACRRRIHDLAVCLNDRQFVHAVRGLGDLGNASWLYHAVPKVYEHAHPPAGLSVLGHA